MNITYGIGGVEAVCLCGHKLLLRIEGTENFRLGIIGQVTFQCPNGHNVQVDAERLLKSLVVPKAPKVEDDNE